MSVTTSESDMLSAEWCDVIGPAAVVVIISHALVIDDWLLDACMGVTTAVVTDVPLSLELLDKRGGAEPFVAWWKSISV